MNNTFTIVNDLDEIQANLTDVANFLSRVQKRIISTDGLTTTDEIEINQDLGIATAAIRGYVAELEHLADTQSKKDYADTVARRLVEARGSRSVEEVSKAVGITEEALKAYEAGLRTPRDEVKTALAEYYGVTCHDLFFL